MLLEAGTGAGAEEPVRAGSSPRLRKGLPTPGTRWGLSPASPGFGSPLPPPALDGGSPLSARVLPVEARGPARRAPQPETASSAARVDRVRFVSRTPLHLACAKGQSDVVRFLARKKCQLNPRDGFKKSPLMKVCGVRYALERWRGRLRAERRVPCVIRYAGLRRNRCVVVSGEGARVASSLKTPILPGVGKMREF